MDALTLLADRVLWAGDEVRAEGHVTLVVGPDTLTAEAATWHRASGVVTLDAGAWARADGTLTFEAATVALADRAADLRVVQAAADPWSLTADALAVGEGAWTGTGVRLTPCACDDGGPPAITFAAATAEVRPGEVAILRGGTIRVFDLPVVPVPAWRVPLDEGRFRLGVPEVGWGEQGLLLGWSGRATVDGWRISGGPAWRATQGPRLRGAAERAGGAGVAATTVRAELGWDEAAGAARGALLARAGAHGEARHALAVDATTDPRYAEDYAVDWVARGVSWRESRALAAWGPLRLALRAPDDAGADTLFAQRLRWELGEGRAAAMAPRAELGFVGAPPWSGGEGRGVGLVGVDGRAGGAWGPVHAAVTGDAGGWMDSGAARGLQGDATAQVELAGWSTAGPVRARWWAGGRAEAHLATGERFGDGLARVRLDAPPPWAAGPSVRGQAVLGDLVGTGELWVPVDAEGLGAEARAVLRSGRVQVEARGRADDPWGELAARWSGDRLGLGAGVVGREDIRLAWADASLRWRRLGVGGGLAWDLGAPGWSGADGRVGYDDGCASAWLTAAAGPDRALPDLGLQLRLAR